MKFSFSWFWNASRVENWADKVSNLRHLCKVIQNTGVSAFVSWWSVSYYLHQERFLSLSLSHIFTRFSTWRRYSKQKQIFSYTHILKRVVVEFNNKRRKFKENFEKRLRKYSESIEFLYKLFVIELCFLSIAGDSQSVSEGSQQRTKPSKLFSVWNLKSQNRLRCRRPKDLADEWVQLNKYW